jgi:3-keto-5-aminohexanoate cleavage enzyme
VEHPVVITAAITGSITTPEESPYLPVTEDQICESAVEAWRAGAAIIHLHARDSQGVPTQDPGVYQRLMAEIRATGCDAILNVSTGSAGGRADYAERLACLALEPELATLDCGSMNFGDERVFSNTFTFLRDAATQMQARGVLPEIEVFDVGMISNALRLIKEGLVDGPGVWQVCLGVRGGAPADLATLAFLVSKIPAGAFWSLLGIGRHQLALNLASLAYGGHVRTGLEDNLYYRKGVLATSNAQLVERVVRLAAEVGRPVASPATARQLLGLAA